MKKRFRKFLFALFALIIIIQFIKPEKNRSGKLGESDIATKYPVPQQVQNVLKASCYDCHSNNTVYPWYAEVQPVAWWLNNHIREGKRDLNFSEFTSYPIRRQYKRLQDINDLVKKDEMPLTSYLIIHRYARLSNEQKQLLFNWVNTLRNSIKANYPADSLIKPKGST